MDKGRTKTGWAEEKEEKVIVDNPFEKEILQFEKEDRNNPPPEKAVLFVGSSSFRLWDSMEEDFSGIKVINRGFGGASFSDIIHYADRIIIPYKPENVLIYAGSHDLHEGNATPEEVLESLKELCKLVWTRLPKTKFYFVSMKPSIAKWGNIELDQKTNHLIWQYSKKTDRFEYIDIWNIVDPEKWTTDKV
ncbi:MAG: hypothetical protein A2X48_12910 [Lentisphaerae bacterium GWF2_49_21]|nr:MAG: hypothetical protein A2X48_12910 [Lentisphaerae bacterium GWF2_49_21]